MIRIMENFQLYRTNLFLGGQMKWDIVLDGKLSSFLNISDFHLTPISNNVSYIYKSDENLLNHSHLDNIKMYYNKIKGNFYSPALDSIFNHNWPILCKENELLSPYSSIYDMGCKRSNSYSKYKKQFEFFCPLWLEKVERDIQFKFYIKGENSDNVISTKTLNFVKNGNAYHDKFIKYLNDYFKIIGLNEGSNDLLNINFSNKEAKITGIDVSTGILYTKNVNSLVNNFLSRERPLMETDNMINQSFVNNTLISKQLLNFNFCFNIDDIAPSVIIDSLKMKNLIVTLEVYVDGVKLEKRDFYSNYEFIDKCVSSDNSNELQFNVLDYLKDNKCISLIDKNKFCQSICHWSLIDNNDYIFNLYDGFSGLYVENILDDEGKSKHSYFENKHHYKNFPDIFVNSANKKDTSLEWINTKYVNVWSDFYKYINDTENTKKEGIYIYEDKFINNVKYNNIIKLDIELSNKENVNGIYVIGLYTTNSLFSKIIDYANSYDVSCTKITNELFILRKNDLMMIITSNINNLTYKNFSNIMFSVKSGLYEFLYKITNNDFEDYTKNLGEEVIFFDVLYSLIENIVYPEKITFTKGLTAVLADGPSKDLNEIKYLKNDNFYNHIFRYDGKLKPTFVKEEINILYYKDYVSNDIDIKKSNLRKSNYMQYIDSGFEPSYPSLNYCSIKKIENWSYDSIPTISVSEYNFPIKLINDIEYSWFNTNKCINLKDELNFVIEAKANNLNKLIKDYISKYYEISDENMISYIISKYSINNNMEYKSNTDIEDFVYNITLTLK